MYSHILLAVDLSDPHSWEKALPTVIDHCSAFDATLHVMTVVPKVGLSMVGQFFPADFEQRALASATDALHAFTRDHVPGTITLQHIISHGTIYEEILQAATRIGADLIVMASHRPVLQDYLLGPNSARVVRHATCSVLVVR